LNHDDLPCIRQQQLAEGYREGRIPEAGGKSIRMSDRRASLLRNARSMSFILLRSGDSIHTGIFNRFPAWSMTDTAPSPRFGLRSI
jgi:hypothetical protein